MHKLLKLIKVLLKNLPQEDLPIAERYLNNRLFLDLYDIVESDIQKATKTMEEEEILDDYISNLWELKRCIISYTSFVEPIITEYEY